MKPTEDLMEFIVCKVLGQDAPSTFELLDASMQGGGQDWRLIFWFKCNAEDMIRTYVVHQSGFKEVWPE